MSTTYPVWRPEPAAHLLWTGFYLKEVWLHCAASLRRGVHEVTWHAAGKLLDKETTRRPRVHNDAWELPLESRDLPTSASLSTMNLTTMLRSRACSTIRWQSGIGVDGHWICCAGSAGSAAAQLPDALALPICQPLMLAAHEFACRADEGRAGLRRGEELNALKPL